MRQCKALAVVFASAFAISGASSTQDFMVVPGAFLVHTRVGMSTRSRQRPSTARNAYVAIFAPPSIASRMRPEAMVPCKTSRAI
jgi:hypothetical protein